MTTIRIKGKTFYPVVNIHDSRIIIHNDVVVGQFDESDYEYILQQMQYDPEQVIFETLEGTFAGDECRFKMCRVYEIARTGVVIGYNSLDVKPKVSAKSITVNVVRP